MGRTQYCYYHLQGRSTAIKYYSEAPYCAVEEDLPLFEDAHSIQIAIRQIASLLMQQKIEHKAAGLLLYSIQLALLNLKQLKAEKPHPAHLIVDVEQFEETLPASAFAETAPPENDSEALRKRSQSERSRQKEDDAAEAEIQKHLEYLLFLGKHLDDPGETYLDEDAYFRLKEALRERANAKAPSEESFVKKAPAKSNESLPPGTIQACAARKLRAQRQHAN